MKTVTVYDLADAELRGKYMARLEVAARLDPESAPDLLRARRLVSRSTRMTDEQRMLYSLPVINALKLADEILRPEATS